MGRPPMGAVAGSLAAALGLTALLIGCTDLGGAVVSPEDEAPPPLNAVVEGLVPGRTVVGDSVRVQGRGFGASTTGATFQFAADGMRADAEVLAWSDTEIVVVVPAGAVTGPTRVERDDTGVAGPEFTVAPRRITYSGDVVPLLDSFGCTSCHGGSGNLNVRPWAELMAGSSDQGPAVVPRRSDQSSLVQRLLSRTPATLRMPQGGPYLDETQILTVADWIDQGARDD